MKFEKTVVSGFEGAFRGLRNPLQSWRKSDSVFGIADVDDVDQMLDFDVASLYCEKEGISFEDSDLYDTYQGDYAEWLRQNGILRWDEYHSLFEYAYLGPKDIDLAHRMIKGNTAESKFLRQINVSVDITAPLYWWKEFDTYKIGTVANSTSTMHKLATTPITLECFETDDYNKNLTLSEEVTDEAVFTYDTDSFTFDLIQNLEKLRLKYLETKDIGYWKELIRWLPESWLQTRTITMSYENLYSIVRQRKNHKLTEWKRFIDWVATLPYSNELIFC